MRWVQEWECLSRVDVLRGGGDGGEQWVGKVVALDPGATVAFDIEERAVEETELGVRVVNPAVEVYMCQVN